MKKMLRSGKTTAFYELEDVVSFLVSLY
jgi:hypothetical protein